MHTLKNTTGSIVLIPDARIRFQPKEVLKNIPELTPQILGLIDIGSLQEIRTVVKVKPEKPQGEQKTPTTDPKVAKAKATRERNAKIKSMEDVGDLKEMLEAKGLPASTRDAVKERLSELKHA